MTGALSAMLPGGRLHLQHGPIDLIVSAEGAGRRTAFDAATERFRTVLEELVAELPLLRSETADSVPQGPVGRRMHRATCPHRPVFITPMAAVAGAVADEVLAAMTSAADLRRAFVNNGGDIALHLSRGTSCEIAVANLDGSRPGTLRLTSDNGVGGCATSGSGGRSHSLGISDGVTVLAGCAASADAAATLIANAVDLPGHASILRRPAIELSPDSDLGTRPVVVSVGWLDRAEVAEALDRGRRVAQSMRSAGRVDSALLTLRGQSLVVGPSRESRKVLQHA